MFFKCPIEIELAFWPFCKSADGVTLWPFIFYRKGHISLLLQKYQYYQWNQVKKFWVLPWYLAYFILMLHYGNGTNHPMRRHLYKIMNKTQDKIGKEIRNCCQKKKNSNCD